MPAYLELLRRPERLAVIQRLRTAALVGPGAIWDPDSYDINSEGLSDMSPAIEYMNKPFAHAFVVAMVVFLPKPESDDGRLS